MTTLTRDEFVMAAHVGVSRFVRDRPGREGQPKDNWGEVVMADIDAAATEVMLCKMGGLYWTGLSAVGAQDTPWGEVRHTRYPNGRLLLRPGDDADSRYFLFTGHAPVYRYRGWAWGRDAMVDAYLRENWRGQYWLMPQEDLCHSGPVTI